MKTYLVTGGAGFIGSNYIQYLFNTYDDNIRVINLDKLTYAGNLENLESVSSRKGYHFVKGDICDTALVQSLFSDYEVDYVVNFAAESHVDRSIKDPEVFVRTNVLGTQVLLNAAKVAWQEGDHFKAGKKFLQISTDEVYGSLSATGYFEETTPLDPHSPYSASKASADMLVKAYYDTYGFPCNITRCSNNYGPYQFPEKLIPLMIHNALNHKALPVYGDGKQIRDWLYVKDHNKAVEMVLQDGQIGQVYNIGGHNEKMNIEIVQLIISRLQEITKDLKINMELIQHVTDRLGHDRRYAIDASKIEQDLGWRPEVFFDEGIVFTIQWYLEHEEWLEHVTSGAYQTYYEQMYEVK